MSALSFLLQGASGRMGQAVLACAAREPARFTAHALISRHDDAAPLLEGCDAAIEFSSAAALGTLLAACRAQRTPLVIGATGHDDSQREAIADAAEHIAIVFAANFSVGVNALFWLARKTAEILGPEFDLEVIETHHRLKKDAPSGTARRLVEILDEVRHLSYQADTRHGREGLIGARPPGEIGLHAVRGGDVVGEHTVLYAGIGERIELTHRASSRETFAAGALRAAEWLRHREPGLYDMEDVLGLRES